MLECMQSLGAAYKACKYEIQKTDYEYEFYDMYLSEYKDQESETGFVKVSDAHQKNFIYLRGSYHFSKSVPASERGIEDKLADSFMFFISIGVIVLLEDGYYVNTNLLAEKNKQFDSVTEKGTSYKKGGIK